MYVCVCGIFPFFFYESCWKVVTLRSISSSDSMSRAELLFSVRTGWTIWHSFLVTAARTSRSHCSLVLPPLPPLVPLPETYSRRLQQLLHRDITGTPFLIEHAIFSTSNFELLRFEHRAFLSEERTYAATWNSVNSFKNKRIDYCYYYDRDRSLRFAKKYCSKEPWFLSRTFHCVSSPERTHLEGP